MLQGQLRTAGSDPSSVLLEDGRSLEVDYEVLDPSGTRHLDQVRVDVTASGDVAAILPLRSLAEAAAILARVGVLTVSPDGQDDVPWTEALFEDAWSTRGEAVFCCDGEYLESRTLEDWLRRSGIAAASVAAGPEVHGEPSLVIDAGHGPRKPVRAVGSDLVWDVNEVAAEASAAYRWYELPTQDDRSVFLRLDRETATALGLGLFATPELATMP